MSALATHSTARIQLKGYGAIIPFDVRGDAMAAEEVCCRVQLFQRATSLGAVSVGIASVDDIWTD
jgi:cystathionine gamma-synthase